MTTEQYIEHEVKLRVHDNKFKLLESKLNFMIALIIGSIVVPVILHAAKLI